MKVGMKASIVLAIAALAAAAAGPAQAQLTAPGGAQPGMQADGEGRSAVPLLRAVRQPEAARTDGQPAGAAGSQTDPGKSGDSTNWRWVWQRGPFLEAADLDGPRSAVGVSAGDNTTYPSR